MGVISNRKEAIRVKGDFFVTYTATRYGKKYTATHLAPCGGGSAVSADELQEQWSEKYKGLCPFNGDSEFEVVKIQQRF